MKKNKRKRILFFLLALTGFFYSCPKDSEKNNQENDYGTLDVIIKNNSNNSYYFDTKDIEHPYCVMNYIDDVKLIKEFYFSTKPDFDDSAGDITIWPSSFSYKLNPLQEIKLKIKLKENFDDYYKINCDMTTFDAKETLIGKSLENYFYMYCSTEEFSYKSGLSDYSKKIEKYGIKLNGKMTAEITVEFIIE